MTNANAPQKVCKSCGKQLVDGSPKKEHCNDACKMRAYRQRKKAKKELPS